MEKYFLYAVYVYGIWLWPLMIVFGFAFGLKRLLSDSGNYIIPLAIAALGIMIEFLPMIL